MGKNNKELSWKNKYKEIKELGEGGNGKVLLVQDINSYKQYALKYLYNESSEKKIRFESEIEILTTVCKGLPGIIPVIDFSKEEHWYVMEVAIPIQKYIKDKSLNLMEIIDGFIQLSETLEQLHNQHISHRDIKPDNILVYEDHFCFGDFGLVSAPEISISMTQNGKDLGAHFTIAPEMKRYPKEADGCNADIFSFAKTLWMVISDDNLGFDGQYNFFSENHKLRNFSSVKGYHIALLEDLIYKATDENPSKRPTASEFKTELLRWEKEEDNKFLAEETEWNFLENKIFPNGIVPESSKWTDLEDIIKIFNLFTFVDATSHIFFPDGGGLNLQKVIKSPENNCMYLIVEGNSYLVLSPKCLYYEKFSDKKWNYFLLELNELQPVFPEKLYREQYCEELCEDIAAHYVCADDFNYGVYSYEFGTPLPKGAKKIQRYFKGRFLVVFGNGYYNAISGTYDARHSDAPIPEDFHKYISKLSIETTILNKELGDNPKKESLIEDYLNKTESENPFKEKEKQTQHRKNKKIGRFLKKLFEFILLHHKYFLFRPKNGKNADINFYITFEKVIESVLFTNEGEQEKCYFLDKNGRLTKKKSDKLLFSSRDSVLRIYNKIVATKKFLYKIIGRDINYDFFIHFEKPLKLRKLFTLDEIKQVMKTGDDRKTQKLVVDENGIPLLIDKGSELCNTYPLTCSEYFVAGNNYLGKYSNLVAADLCYKELLIKYLLLLKNESWYHKYEKLSEEEIIMMVQQKTSEIDNCL